MNEKDRAIGEVIKAALSTPSRRRSSLAVTADRLGDLASHPLLTGEERDCIGVVIQAIDEIESGSRLQEPTKEETDG